MVEQGTLEDAKWASFGANIGHGLKRNVEDKRRAIKGALLHPKGHSKNNREIGKYVGCSDQWVSQVRSELLQAIGGYG